MREGVASLREGVPITVGQLDALADLTERRKTRGRRPDPSARAEMKRLVVAVVRRQERQWKNAHRAAKQLSRGTREHFIEPDGGRR
jgi:hypothetical protein